MKKLLLLVLIAVSISAFGQKFSYSKRINGLWGNWETPSYNMFVYKLIGTTDIYNEFIIYGAYDHPSKYILKVIMLGQVVETDKKKRKEAIKSGKWYEYPAMVEYYTANMSDRFKDIINRWPLDGYNTDFEKHYVPATVTIPPYKDKPVNYNIWFEELGLAIQLK
ncbi:hypothetical protein [Pedobacter endophyticus]|uniref:Uncharacterized protein n=1 Tax=Pedobacter endophyticus TaxID=2789740 RepID=A0A7U3Q3J5_9SPHI|nr:hypothetical protein [Pedobacter endophyticus]QPH37899.1 hypothetical protein IZT61_12350 [Pedobacter endophyticus]